jgi:hypothetical protein
MSTFRTKRALQTGAGGIAADGQRVELSDRRFEGKGRVHSIGNQRRAVSFTWPDVAMRARPPSSLRNPTFLQRTA